MESQINSCPYCTVRILDVPYHLDADYDYYIPPNLAPLAKKGAFVTVPFGRSNRKTAAVITSFKEECEYDRVKPISDIPDIGETMTEDEAQLCRFLCDYTLCSYGEAVKTVVPATVLITMNEYYSVTGIEKGMEKLSQKALLFYSYVKTRERVSAQTMKNKFGEESAVIAQSLIRLGLMTKESRMKETTNIKYVKFVSLCSDVGDIEEICSKMRSPVQSQIVRLLSKTGRITADEIFVRIEKSAAPQLTALEKKGIVEITKEEIYRDPYFDNRQITPAKESPLSDEQRSAVDALTALYEADEPKAALLHGVTGSGKTRVIKEMIDRVTKDNKGVILLVPEISLTPQTVGYFCAQYKDRVAVIHSSLSKGERFDAWKRLRRGEADIVIGTRSAIFAPVRNLGMIVIDEEQEHTYKSDTDPKYLAHDVARFRAGKTGSLMLLSSATPSFNSYHKAKTGVYTLVEMQQRYGAARLPEVVISDMRFEGDAGNVSPIGTVLAESLKDTYKNGKQSIVFLNRRGYNSAVSCRVCGEAVTCPSCSVSLTYHTNQSLDPTEDAQEYFRMRVRRGMLCCHYCGYKTAVPERCPSCNAEHFRFMGCGTQRVEEELKSAVPGAGIIRMDMDTTSQKGSHSEILEKFRERKADILLGTQMVTKGHDFPAVTLVGVMNADASLFLDDYRASEKTFSLLTQVIGRAGRGEDAGIAVVQTSNPESDVIRLAAAQDYKTFFDREIKLRRALVFPPFCDIAVLTLSGTDEALLTASAARVGERIRELLKSEYSDVEAVVFGPFEAPVYKIQNNCRMRFCIKCRLNRRSRSLIKRILFEFGKSVKNISITADLNPSSL